MPDQQTWNPVAEFKQNWPDSRLSDDEILKNLQDPAKFRSAFPHYTGVTDAQITSRMKSYSPAPATSTPKAQGQAEPFSFTDLIPQAALPALKKTQDILTQPIGKTLGFQKQTLSEAYTPQSDPVQGGVHGAGEDVKRVGSQIGLGLGDFLQSPAGLASGFLTAATGGAAAPFLAAGFAAGQTPEAYEAYKVYKSNPTPENLQNALVQAAMVPAMAAGAKGEEIGKIQPAQITKGERAALKGNINIGDNRSQAAVPTEAPRQYVETIDGIQPVPSQASQGAAYRPQAVYKPSEKAAVMSAERPNLGPEFEAAQIAHEVERNKAILRNPKATDFDRSVASSRLKEMAQQPEGARVEPTPPTKGPIEVAGLVDKGELVKGAGIYQIEHPDFPGLTATASAEDLKDLQVLRNKMAAKLDAFADNPTVVPGQKAQIPADLRAAARSLRGEPTPDPSPVPFTFGGADGPMRPYDPDGTRFSKGTTVGLPKLDPYYKPPVVEQVTASDAALAPVQDFKPVQEVRAPQRADSFELNQNTQDSLGLLMKTWRMIQEAPTPEARAAAQTRWNDLSKMSKQFLKDHFNRLDIDQHRQLLDQMQSEGDRLQRQAQAVNDVIAGDKVAKALRGEMKEGRPAKAPIGAEPQGRNYIVDTLHSDLRSVIHEMLGDKTSMQWDEVAVQQRAKAREAGLDPDTVQPEGYRRVPQEAFQSMRDEAKNELREIQDTFKKRVKDMVDDRLEKNPSLVQEQGEEAAKNIHAQVMRELLNEVDKDGKNITDRVRELRDLMGRDPQRPLYVKKGAPIEEGGVVKAPGDIQEKSLETARRIWGTKLNRIPSEAEWELKAKEFAERSRLHKAIAQGVSKFLDIKVPKTGEAGYVGEAVLERPQETKPAPIPSTDQLLKNADNHNIKVSKITDETPAGYAGWLTPDGKHFVDKGVMSHDDVASTMLLSRGSTGQRALLDNGWIRKVNLRAYEVGRLGDKAVNTIEMDLIRNQKHGHDVLIDTRTPYGVRTLHIDGGYEDLGDAIKSQLKQDARFGQQGNVPSAAIMGGMAAGGIAGATAGSHFGPLGTLVGGSAGMVMGAVAPAILKTPIVRNAMRTMAPIIRGAGVSMRQFFQGVPQLDVASPDMARILAEQQAHADPSSRWVERAKQLPASVYKGFEPFAFVADQKNMGAIGKLMMSFDPRGRAFRDLTLPDTQSLYVALRNAGGSALGQRAFQGFQYNDIKIDANKAGLRQALDIYLNYKGYERVHDVLNEHVQDLQQQEQNLQTKLQSPSNTVRQTAALQDDLKEVRGLQADIQKKVQSGQANPGGYTPNKLAQEMQDFQQRLGPQFQEVKALADRAFQARVRILDMLHDNGIVSDQNYSTFVARGPEYVPMERIVDDLANSQPVGSPQPLHLRHQTVIQTLEGSTRTNVNPWEAFDHADRKAFNQIYRNDAMRHALDLAQAYPQTIGQDFKPVVQGYRAKAGEMILGHYDQGQPRLYAVPEYLGQTMQNLPMAAKSALGAAANWFGHQFKKAATVGNIGFQVSSLINHALSSALLPSSGLKLDPTLPVEAAKFVRGWAKSVKEVLNQSPEYREMVRSGAAFGTFQRMLDPDYFASPSEQGFRGKLAKGRILDAAQDLAAGLEDINRVNTYSRARASGLSEKAAGWQTKQFGGAPDFSRLGDMSQPINQALMFFNASNQYLHQAVSAIRKDPQRIGGLMIGLATATIALNQWNQGQKDSQGNVLLRKVPIFDRQRNWVITLPQTYRSSTGAELPYTIKIPKPKIAQLLNPIEDLVNYANGTEVRSGTQQALDSISNVSPIHTQLDERHIGQSAAQSVVSSLHPLAKTAIEQYSNMNEFGYPIVPQSQQGIDAAFQVGPNTSQAARRMGQGNATGAIAGGVLGGILGSTFGGYPGGAVGAVVGSTIGASGPSPRRIDAGLRSLTAGQGSMATSLMDPFLGGVRKPMEGPEAARSLPVVGPIVSRFTAPPFDAEYENLSKQFYGGVQMYAQKASTYAMLSKTNPEAAVQYMQQNKDAIFRGKMGMQLQAKLKELNDTQRAIEANAAINPEAKKVALKNLYDVRLNLLRTFNNILQADLSGRSGDTNPLGAPNVSK
jgi:hypothetical protein